MIPLAFSPAEIIFVDDKQEFFKPIALSLNENFSYSFFTDTQKALRYISHPKGNRHTFHQCEEIIEDTGFRSFATRYDFTSIPKIIFSNNRFANISVVIADYAMPQMNGIEFLSKIQDKHIKKILLTGEADEKIAVDAFNNGLIHQYIKKAKYDFMRELNTAIYQFTKDYWNEATQLPKQILGINYKHLPFNNPDVEKHLNSIIEQYEIVEYYLLEGTFRFLLLNAMGHPYTLWIQSKEEAHATAYEFQSCDALHAPQFLKDAVNAYQKIVCVPLVNGIMNHVSEWHQYCRDAVNIANKGAFYAAIEPGCDLPIKDITPFKALKQITEHFPQDIPAYT